MPTNTANKVKFGLKNVYYSVITEGANGALSFATPVTWPGAVSLSMNVEGDNTKFHADDGVYFARYANNGYSGTLETALVPDGFRTDVLGETVDSKGVYLENSNATPTAFALLFEFTGDQHQIRHVLYNCNAARPAVSSTTKGDNVEVQTESIDITAGPALFGTEYYVKAKTGPDTDSTTYAGWFSAVYTPTVAAG